MKDNKSPETAKEFLKKLGIKDTKHRAPITAVLAGVENIKLSDVLEAYHAQFTPSKDAEEAFEEWHKGQIAAHYKSVKEGAAYLVTEREMTSRKDLAKIAFMAGRSSQPIERVDANALHDIFYQKYQNYLLHKPEGCMKRAFIETLASISSHPTNKMREALEGALSILKQTKAFRDANGLTMGNIFLDSAITQAESALSTNPTDNTK